MPDRETEVKIRVESVRDARSRLEKAGLSPTHTRDFEDNFLFDTPERSLRLERSLLRLRRYGDEWAVTYKGTPSADQTYKSRVEIEMKIGEPKQMRKIFLALGYRPAFRYQKYRTHYSEAAPAGGAKKKKASALGDVTLDETPIGTYLELEGSRRWIDRIARQLGFSRKDYMTQSYGALYLEYCRKMSVAPGDMVFKAAAKRRSGTESSSDRKTHHRKKTQS